MTTLQAIGFTLAGGSAVCATSVALFGIAVSHRSIFIAPRATARPRNVIYNPHASRRDQQQHPVACQDRGGPMFGWIPWVLNLTYDTMLMGVPGTGTREGGLSGSLLRVNMDGIVLLRFHAMCRRLAVLATTLCICILLPVYYSAQCYSSADLNSVQCSSAHYNLTNYDRTTLANVPAYLSNQNYYSNNNTLSNNITAGSANWTTVFLPKNGILWRLYCAVFCVWILIAYTFQLLDTEWIQILAMRRVYYLEFDLWNERKRELQETLLAAASRERMKKLQTKKSKKPRPDQQDEYDEDEEWEDEMRLNHREPWIPHPEQRETVPNVALYSLLVGCLPSLPEHVETTSSTSTVPLKEHDTTKDVYPGASDCSPANYDGDVMTDPEKGGALPTAFTKRDSIDWQLSLTATFFDHCVPNQPGFSSSVAAVTVLPSAKEMTVAWRKWYTAAGKLRRLRFIRRQIAQLRQYDIDQVNDYHEDDDDDGDDDNAEMHVNVRDFERGILTSAMGTSGFGSATKDSRSRSYSNVLSTTSSPSKEALRGIFRHDDLAEIPNAERTGSGSPDAIYQNLQKQQSYVRQVLGSVYEEDTDAYVFEAIAFGPEQAAVYSREFAQAAAPCCPNGCREERIRLALIDELLEAERQAAAEVHQANLELRQVRRKVTNTTGTPSNAVAAQQSQQMFGGSDPRGRRTEPRPPPDLRHTKIPSSLGLEAHLYQRSRSPPPPSFGAQSPPPPRSFASRTNNHSSKSISGMTRDSGTTLNASSKSLTLKENIADTEKMPRPESEGMVVKASKLLGGTLDVSRQFPPPSSTSQLGSRSPYHVSSTRVPVASTVSPYDASRPSTDGAAGMMLLSSIAGSAGEEEESKAEVDMQQLPTEQNFENAFDNEFGPFSRAPLGEDKEGDSLMLNRIIGNTPNNSLWSQVESIVHEAKISRRSHTHSEGSLSRSLQSQVPSGLWMLPTIQDFSEEAKARYRQIMAWAKKQSSHAVDKLARDSTYAVVTFTSRQAAVAARNCLADGRGAGRWISLPDIPIPPLADAAACDFCMCRNCCRPVTISINDRQKCFRGMM